MDLDKIKSIEDEKKRISDLQESLKPLILKIRDIASRISDQKNSYIFSDFADIFSHEGYELRKVSDTKIIAVFKSFMIELTYNGDNYNLKYNDKHYLFTVQFNGKENNVSNCQVTLDSDNNVVCINNARVSIDFLNMQIKYLNDDINWLTNIENNRDNNKLTYIVDNEKSSTSTKGTFGSLQELIEALPD